MIGDVFLTEELWDEWLHYYNDFYREDEQVELNLWERDEETFLCYDRSMQRIMPWLSKRGVRRTCPHVAGTCRDIDCCRGTEAVQEPEEDVKPPEKEEEKPSTARLVVGKRKKKKGKQGKWVAMWNSM
jgi:hypothetical protein